MNHKSLLLGFLAILCSLSKNRCKMDRHEKINELTIMKDGRSEILFDAGWRFYRGDVEQGEKMEYDDSSWRLVDLPHDWSVEDIPGTNSPIDSNAIGGIDAGYLGGGTGWDPKTFML